MLMKNILFCFILSLFFSNIYSQQIGNTSPDRPDRTESPEILYKNFVQFEMGANYEKNNSDPDAKSSNYSIPEMMIRYGLHEKVELRLEVNYAREETSYTNYNENNSGLKPLELGVKVKLFEEKKLMPETSVLFILDIPGTGNKTYRLKHFSPSLEFLFSNVISDEIDIGYNAGISWDNEEKTNTESYSVSLNISPFTRFSFFTELYGYFGKSIFPDLRMDYGVTYIILKNLNVDISSGFGFSKISPDYFIDFGFSLRLPK